MTKTDITLPAELVEQVLKLTPEQQDKLIDLLYDAVEGPPDDLSATLKERVEDVLSGKVQTVTGDEVDERIRSNLVAARAARRS
jgi:putative addiction module component (TIGR02574 family)